MKLCRMAYDADEDGWAAKAFHERCDGYGSAVSIQTLNKSHMLELFLADLHHRNLIVKCLL